MVFQRIQNLEVDQYFEGLEVLYRRTTKKWSESGTRSRLKIDPISWQTRFISFQRSSRGIQSHRLSRHLPDEF
ncbi:hypothetical protein RclHR1_08300006 [Rhizophagus clarus]|uniref:Uncharacterized protein n=1 Tax=Rhizophagus clarus TaxID=94130 RepID=A0A2Z6SEV0_9GLOM|nr:hypothetical protein RclHR1_08300006 [Rhizophagus clarus]